MEGEEIKNEVKTPLLDGWKLSYSGRRNSVTTLRGDFLARLPEKVKSCVNVDVESSSSNIDNTKSSSLSKGNPTPPHPPLKEKEKRGSCFLIFWCIFVFKIQFLLTYVLFDGFCFARFNFY